MKSSMFELGLRNTTLGARDFSSAVSGFSQVFIVTRAASAFGTREKPLVPRVRWSFHMWLFSRVNISCFRAKAHLVFHWCLYNNVLFVLRFATIQTCTPVFKAMFFTIFCCCCCFCYLFIYSVVQTSALNWIWVVEIHLTRKMIKYV